MKNNITSAILFLWIVSFSGVSTINAQERKLAKAHGDYEQYDYVDAQKVYLAVVENGYESEEVFTKLGNSFYFNAQYDKAVKWYQRLFSFTQEPSDSIVLLRYAQSLKATANNKLAKKYYNAYLSKKGTNPNVKTAIDYQALIQQNSGRYQLKAIDGIYDESKISFGHSKLNNKLIYASTNKSESFINTKSAWDGLSFLSLYEVELDEQNQTIGTPKELKGALNSKFHESSPIYTKDGNTMYFSRSNLSYKDRKNDQKLKIYRSKRVDGKWQEAEELNINSDTYSSAHPALSPDETKLYFSSDRPGGFGESDLYVAPIQADGSIGSVVNLGDKINTGGKDTFPFVTSENELYFSSDGHFGLGGLDVFYVKIKENGFGNLLNIGEPVNSYADDFAFGINHTSKRGFISSNRSQKEGEFVYDNIYSFIETAPIQDPYLAVIDGYVLDKQTGKPLALASVTLIDAEAEVYAKLNTDEKGYYKVETNKFESYFIKAEKEGYDTDEKVSQANLETQQIDFQLQQNKVVLEEGVDLAKVLNIPIIYFDFDKSNIRQDAQVELEKVFAALKQYPQLKLNIRSHTDSRGNDAYNKTLSERRAQATLNYLVEKGIDNSRLKYEGLGERELVNNCSNGVVCTAEEHQKNRRSEFIVIK